MAGINVTRSDLDWKAARTIQALRSAFNDVEIVFNYLSQHPSNAPEGDLLTKSEAEGGFGYTADEAYLIRVVFEGLHNLDVEPLLAQGSKLTGLE